MKFGKTYEERKKQEEAELASRLYMAESGIRTPVFAWMPITLDSGKRAWLEFVWMFEKCYKWDGHASFTTHYEEVKQCAQQKN